MNNRSVSFAHTMRALEADGMRPTLLAVILVAALLLVWSGWLVAARVPVYQISDSARLEVERIYPVAASVVGRVAATSLVLGREVHEGDVLLEVEADRQQLETAEERTRLGALGSQIEALDREATAEEQALKETQRASKAALDEAAQKVSAAEAAADQAEAQASRLGQLAKQGLAPIADLDKAQLEQKARVAEVAAARAGVERLRAEQVAAERSRRGQLASLLRERASLEGLRAAGVSIVARREREADLRRVRAPVSGRLGEVSPLQVGAIVREGDHLASIIPDGQVRVVGEFPAPALGRVRAGQPARVRLDAFPWAQYGHVDAVVTSVASETREQRVRVELDVRRTPDLQIPLEHGMPGSVEVEVERAAPIALVVRSLGQAVTGVTAAAAPRTREDDPNRSEDRTR